MVYEIKQECNTIFKSILVIGDSPFVSVRFVSLSLTEISDVVMSQKKNTRKLIYQYFPLHISLMLGKQEKFGKVMSLFRYS